MTGTRHVAGVAITAISGSSAPSVNATAEAPAARHGLVSSSGSRWSSASTWAESASCSVSSTATCRAVARERPFSS